MANRRKMSRRRRKTHAILKNIILALIMVLGLVLIWKFAIPTAQKGMELLGGLNTADSSQSSVSELSTADPSVTGESSGDSLQAEAIESDTEDGETTGAVNADSSQASEVSEGVTTQPIANRSGSKIYNRLCTCTAS